MNKAPKILIIDDETDICSLLRFLLAREGFDPHISVSSEEGLQRLLSENFDGVVCDYAMPGMNGVTLLKRIRAEKNFTPFIFLSGHAGLEEEHEMVNLGAFDLIIKPHVNQIAPALKKLLHDGFEMKCLEKSGSHAEDFLVMLHEAKKIA